MDDIEQIVDEPYEKKGFLRRAINFLGVTTLLGTTLLLGASGCSKDEDDIVTPPPPVDTTAPADVSNFTATAGNKSIDLTWMNPSDIDFAGVMIRRKTASFPANPTDGTLAYNGTAQSHTDSGLTAGTTYRYRIFSFDEVPNHSSGTTAFAVPFDSSDTTPPGEVSSFIATSGDNLINLSWINPGDADFAGVLIRRKTASFPANPTDGILVYTGTSQAHTDSGLTNGINYLYKIFSFDFVPNHSSGTTGSAIPADITAPGNVTGFSAIAKYLSVDLAWTNPGDADFAGVKILRKTGFYPANPTDGTVAYTGTGQTHTDSGLVEKVNYYYTAFSFDEVPNHPSGSNATAQPYGVYAIGWIGGGSNGWKTSSGTTFVAGGAYQTFGGLASIYVTNNGDIYIADSGSCRISKWNSSGNAIGWIGAGSNGWKTSSSTSAGNDYQSLDHPDGIFVDGTGDIYIADTWNHRVSKWDGAGNAIGWIGGGTNGWKTSNGSSLSGNYQGFYFPSSVFVDSSNGDIYVADFFNHRVSKWNAAGNAIGWIGGGSNGWKTSIGASAGSDFRSFDNPHKIYLDSSKNIYVAEQNNNRISKWSAAGNAIGWIGGGSNGWKTSIGTMSGSDYQSFDDPRSVFIDNSGNIYIADNFNERVSKWNAAGNAIGWIGGGSNGWKTGIAPSSGSDYQSFNSPRGIFVNTTGTTYVSDAFNWRISKWKD
ncbi:MAG: hypothetical protein KAT43_00040 [Nanoarchaeota archaeon]|nr:hypothetical protein [Nanoarchaeota archaeon]